MGFFANVSRNVHQMGKDKKHWWKGFGSIIAAICVVWGSILGIFYIIIFVLQVKQVKNLISI